MNAYEAAREAKIRENRDLLASLGILKPTTPVTRKAVPLKVRSAPKTKSAPKIPTPSSEDTVSRERLPMTPSDSGSESPSLRRSGRARRAPIPFERSSSLAFDDELYTPPATPNNKRAYISDDDDAEDRRARKAQRLGIRIHDPKQFGAIPGISVGTQWDSRMACSTAAVHAPTIAGISGNRDQGAWSISLSGGYEDDVDLGEAFTYTGAGGRDLKGTAAAPKNLRTAPQSCDQTFDSNLNAALLKSSKTGKPVRVIRGFKATPPYAPFHGYVYSGLYICTKAWLAEGISGYKVCKYAFQRLPGQDPLPTFTAEENEAEEQSD